MLLIDHEKSIMFTLPPTIMSVGAREANCLKQTFSLNAAEEEDSFPSQGPSQGPSPSHIRWWLFH